jgi:hypothetical protein
MWFVPGGDRGPMFAAMRETNAGSKLDPAG